MQSFIGRDFGIAGFDGRVVMAVILI